MEKEEVLKKFYGGVRKPYMHKFSADNGVCEYCDTFIGDENGKKGGRICKVITPDEVKRMSL